MTTCRGDSIRYSSSAGIHFLFTYCLSHQIYAYLLLLSSCKTQITRFLASALTDEDFGGPQGQAEFVRALGVEARQGGGAFLSALLRDLAEELSTLDMFDEVSTMPSH